MSDSADEWVERLEALVDQARGAGVAAGLEGALRRLADSVREVETLDEGDIPSRFGIVGASPPMLELFGLIGRLQPYAPARIIHDPSSRERRECCRFAGLGLEPSKGVLGSTSRRAEGEAREDAVHSALAAEGFMNDPG